MLDPALVTKRKRMMDSGVRTPRFGPDIFTLHIDRTAHAQVADKTAASPEPHYAGFPISAPAPRSSFCFLSCRRTGCN